LLRQNVDGDSLLAPYNLVTAWYWVYEDAEIPPRSPAGFESRLVRGRRLFCRVVGALDQDGNGSLEETGCSWIRLKNRQLSPSACRHGTDQPRIDGEVQPCNIFIM
jgi:hypothetical protein